MIWLIRQNYKAVKALITHEVNVIKSGEDMLGNSQIAAKAVPLVCEKLKTPEPLANLLIRKMQSKPGA